MEGGDRQEGRRAQRKTRPPWEGMRVQGHRFSHTLAFTLRWKLIWRTDLNRHFFNLLYWEQTEGRQVESWRLVASVAVQVRHKQDLDPSATVKAERVQILDTSGGRVHRICWWEGLVNWRGRERRPVYLKSYKCYFLPWGRLGKCLLGMGDSVWKCQVWDASRLCKSNCGLDRCSNLEFKDIKTQRTWEFFST